MEPSNQLEKIRSETKRRIHTGQITTLELARKLGIGQPAVFNFVAGNRNLSWLVLNRLMEHLRLDIQTSAEKATASLRTNPVEIPLVRSHAARSVAIVKPEHVLRTVYVSNEELQLLPVVPGPRRLDWTRLVAIRPLRSQVEFMYPRFTRESVLVLDRHCDRICPGHTILPMYAVDNGKEMRIGFLHQKDGRIVLAPERSDFPAEAVTLPPDKHPSHNLIGHVCLILQRGGSK